MEVERKYKKRSPAQSRWLARRNSQNRFREQERALIGDIAHVGHLPFIVDEIEGWTFRRCPCGFDLALSPSSRLYWLRKTHEARELTSLAELIAALAKPCRFHWIRKFDRPLVPASEGARA